MSKLTTKQLYKICTTSILDSEIKEQYYDEIITLNKELASMENQQLLISVDISELEQHDCYENYQEIYCDECKSLEKLRKKEIRLNKKIERIEKEIRKEKLRCSAMLWQPAIVNFKTDALFDEHLINVILTYVGRQRFSDLPDLVRQ